MLWHSQDFYRDITVVPTLERIGDDYDALFPFWIRAYGYIRKEIFEKRLDYQREHDRLKRAIEKLEADYMKSIDLSFEAGRAGEDGKANQHRKEQDDMETMLFKKHEELEMLENQYKEINEKALIFANVQNEYKKFGEMPAE
ncbi:MAG TPA: hypothetical protein VJH34_02925 [archaeon]|nr:hypothetical protein [archaeon]